jgi:hypothetical protein
MGENVSDRNGRALEYAVTVALKEHAHYSLSESAVYANRRDQPKFDALPTNLKVAYENAARKITAWTASIFHGEKTVIVERLDDDASDPTDILIASDSRSIKLSLKHNHSALKHPRPYSFAQFCGYAKDSHQDTSHRLLMAQLEASFRKHAGRNAMFKDCSASTIDQLYADICNACRHSLEVWLRRDSNLPAKLFQFLVSSGFYKVIVETRSGATVSIEDYLTISLPEMVTVVASGNRLILKFDNGWELNLRIHTASSRIAAQGSQLSLKFDAQKTAGKINSFKL